MANLFPAVGAAVALAGTDKLAGIRPYEGLFRHLGWSRSAMRMIAALEVTGGLLMIPRSTRGIGGALVMAASAMVIGSELDHGDSGKAVPRGLVLFAGLAAMLATSRPVR